MLTPGYANLLAYFYPIGNTPAVCLTQGLPPEKKADILLLGCGDVRHILFTLHCDSKGHQQKAVMTPRLTQPRFPPVRHYLLRLGTQCVR